MMTGAFTGCQKIGFVRFKQIGKCPVFGGDFDNIRAYGEAFKLFKGIANSYFVVNGYCLEFRIFTVKMAIDECFTSRV